MGSPRWWLSPASDGLADERLLCFFRPRVAPAPLWGGINVGIGAMFGVNTCELFLDT
jgi:hypothetical protein